MDSRDNFVADSNESDRILTLTRVISAAIVPFLFAAFLILYVSPQPTGRWFAWDINPRMTAAYMGAGYLGGAYVFIHAVTGSRWHRVARAFLPVTVFTIFMLLATIVHWDTFELSHLPFLIWLALYILTPILLPWIWLRNRETDPGTMAVDDAQVPMIARWILAGLGIVLLFFAVLIFVRPSVAIQIWPWTLSLLTTRVMSAWSALLGVGGLVIARDNRWSAWRAGLEGIALWHFLVLIAAAFNRFDFKDQDLLNWYIISVVIMLIAMIFLYILMETRRRTHTP